MIRRPKPGEGEDELLRMQEEFLQEKKKNQGYQPAAQVVNLRKSEPVKRPNTTNTERKPSKYAQAKGLTNHSEKRQRTETSPVGEILEKNIEAPKEIEAKVEDDKVYFPIVIPSIIGDIVEKNVESYDFNFESMPSKGFPEVTKSVPAPGLSRNRVKIKETMDIDSASSSTDTKLNPSPNLPTKSYIVTSKEASEIHNENVKLLSTLTEEDILEERQKILATIDPKLVEFIKSKRQGKTGTKSIVQVVSEPMDICSQVEKHQEISRSQDIESSSSCIQNDLWDNDVLSHPEVNHWLHFDSLEKDKLEWMKGVQESNKINPDEPYEARFDLKGYLLPYTIDYTEETKVLFHHGEEPHRPGYTLKELTELTRSSVTQQRVMALNILAGILEYNSAGTYKDIIDLPLSKIFFLIRITMDENKVIILEPALKAMRNLLYNRIDEASLDALIGFDEGTIQPCLQNDKLEIEELQSTESDLKDFYLAEIDLISAFLRTDILQRLYYILDVVQPSFNCVQYTLQILTRLARDSVETALLIVQCDHLMKSIIRNFLPTTAVNFVFDPKIVYKGRPILAAVRLIRILSLQCREVGNILTTKYDILRPISEYISSGVDRTYGLRIQTEAHCVLSNLLNYRIGIDKAIALLPVVVNTLHKHVNGTDIYVTSSIISATHAAVVIQLINRLLRCNLSTIDNYKAQIYPLLKLGLQKWIKQLCQAEAYTSAHLRLVCSAFDCSRTVLLIESFPMKFLTDSLQELALSRGFKELVKNLILSSNLLSGLEDKHLHLTKNLMSLGGSVVDSTLRVLPILNIVTPLPILTSLFKLLTQLNDQVLAENFLVHLTPYLEKLVKTSPSLSNNWFTRMETDFLFNVLKLSTQTNLCESDKDLYYAVANKLCFILRIDKRFELDFLFNQIVFNKDWFSAVRLLNLMNVSDAEGLSQALTSIDEIKVCYSKVINVNYKDTGPNVLLVKWREPILPRDWIYLPILMMYSKSQEADTPQVSGEHAKKVEAQVAKDKEFIITCSLEWILFNELCFPDLLKDIGVTDRLCRIMCVFLSDNCLFLDPKIKVLLRKCAQTLFKLKEKFNFDKPLMGLHNFQDFYTQFLEQFQSVSYGDSTFAACVLVPLAQRHNVKWRKLIWSEYAGCLRALDCPEDLLCYNIKDYLYPEETEESVIKSYFRALSSNLLRPNTVAHKIALHHVECYKKRQETVNNN